MPDLTYRCPCGAIHAAGTWGAFHWSEPLVHRCQCGRENHIRSGKVLHSIPPKGKTKPREEKKA